MKSLSKHEKHLFSLTGSSAKTVGSQKAAIRRAGLEGLGRNEIEKIRRDNWLAFRQEKKELPSWLAAAQYSFYYVDWQHELPKSVKVGKVVECSRLRNRAYFRTNWGRYRKHACGKSNPFGYRVREVSNGKTGWDCVVDRYADYGCVLSPDGKKIAVQIENREWFVTAVFRNRFLFEGEHLEIENHFYQRKYTEKEILRSKLAFLKHAGFEAKCVRQTATQIQDGSLEDCRDGKAVIVVNFGKKFGVWHPSCNDSHRSVREVVAQCRAAFLRRKEIAAQQELEALVDQTAANIYVCEKDSYRAGNCIPGTMQFAQSHKLNLSWHYCAADLLKIANGSARFVKAAVLAAMRREHTENERGYCDLSDHFGGAN